MLLMTIFQKYRLLSVFPSLHFFNLGQVLAFSSLQSSNSEEARTFPSLMAWTNSLIKVFNAPITRSFRKGNNLSYERNTKSFFFLA
jgi:hypothetical protein